jgi:hypothetical protein
MVASAGGRCGDPTGRRRCVCRAGASGRRLRNPPSVPRNGPCVSDAAVQAGRGARCPRVCRDWGICGSPDPRPGRAGGPGGGRRASAGAPMRKGCIGRGGSGVCIHYGRHGGCAQTRRLLYTHTYKERACVCVSDRQTGTTSRGGRTGRCRDRLQQHSLLACGFTHHHRRHVRPRPRQRQAHHVLHLCVCTRARESEQRASERQYER